MPSEHVQRRTRVSRLAQGWLEQDPLFVDVETTGLGKTDEIISVSVVDSRGTVLLDTLVKPSKPIPPIASRINKIKDADVADAPDGGEVSRQLAALLDGRLVCMYNADFDCRLIAQTAGIWNAPAAAFEPACVMKLHGEYAGVQDERRGGWKWWKLPDAVAAHQLPKFDGHRSLPDTQATLSLLEYIASAPVDDREYTPPPPKRRRPRRTAPAEEAETPPVAAAVSPPPVTPEPATADEVATTTCPYCAETIRAEAFVCRYCGRDLPAVSPPQVRNPSECPFCGRAVHPLAMVCAGCNRVLPAGREVSKRQPPRRNLRLDNVAVIVILIGVLVLLYLIAPHVLPLL